MTILNYLMTIKNDIGEFTVEEDHKRKLVIVRSSRSLTNEQKQEVWNRAQPLGIQYIVTGVAGATR